MFDKNTSLRPTTCTVKRSIASFKLVRPISPRKRLNKQEDSLSELLYYYTWLLYD